MGEARRCEPTVERKRPNILGHRAPDFLAQIRAAGRVFELDRGMTRHYPAIKSLAAACCGVNVEIEDQAAHARHYIRGGGGWRGDRLAPDFARPSSAAGSRRSVKCACRYRLP